jgi:hypothetical protein
MENELDTSTTCIGKLERCYNTLQYFRTRIDSYLYEPTTMALFETKVYLKDKICKLVAANETLLDYLKLTNELLPDLYQSVNVLIKETEELENDVLEYTHITRKSINILL